MKLVIPAAILLSGFLICTSSMSGTTAYAKREKKACTVCHVKVVAGKEGMKGNLNNVGLCYKSNNYSMGKCETVIK